MNFLGLAVGFERQRFTCNRHFVIKITIFKHSVTVLVFINMNYLIMMGKLGNINCLNLPQSQRCEINHPFDIDDEMTIILSQ